MTNDSTGNSKTCKDGLFQDFDDNIRVICHSRNDFNPFGDIINSNGNVLKAVGIEKGAHEVVASDIKDFDDKNRSERHLISTG